MKLLHIFAFLLSFIAVVSSVAADDFPVAANSVTLIVGKDGQVYASGDAQPNRGDASKMVRNHFEPIAGLKNIVSVDVDGEADDGAVALDKNGEVWMWGRDWCDVVRGKKTTDIHVPFKHPGLSGIQSVDLDEGHLVALHKDGRVLTIGSSSTANELGALGNGTLETPAPIAPNFGVVQVEGITDAVAVAAGRDVSLIVRRDGTVWAMGARTMLGEPMSALAWYSDKNFANKLPVPVPRRIKGLRDITAVAAGLQFAIALDRKGQVWGWGNNDDGQLGTKITNGDAISPIKIDGLKDIVSISAGSDFMLAADSSGNVFARGASSHGDVYRVLGQDDEGADGQLYRVPHVAGAKQVVAGAFSAFAVLADGSVMGWGANNPAEGGFITNALPTNIPPTKIDIYAKPAPPSEVILAGGVKLNLYFDLSYFQSESVRLEIDGKEVCKFDVNKKSDRQELFIEIPAGAHEYQIKGQAIAETGQRQAITGSGVILVSKQTMREKFDALVGEHGLIAGTEKFIKSIDDSSDRLSLSPLVFTKSPAWNDQQLNEAEKKLGLRLPKSYRGLMKTIGPFQLKHPDCPHPSVSLLPVDAKRDLESFVQQLLKEDLKKLPPSAYRSMVEETLAMTGELSKDRVLTERKTWNKNLIAGSAEEGLYLLIGESFQGQREAYSILWTLLFEPHEDDDGEMLPYFQWTEYCGGDDRATDLLADSIFNVLSNHYDLQGVAPLVPDASGNFTVAAISSLDTEDDDDTLTYGVSTDGW